MTLDSAQSHTTDAKALHPNPPAGGDANAEQHKPKADAPVGGGFGAATLADVRRLAGSVEKTVASAVSEGHLLLTPILGDAKDPAKPAAPKAGEANLVSSSDAKSSPAGKAGVADPVTKPADTASGSGTFSALGTALKTAAEAVLPSVVVDAASDMAGMAWNTAGNYATDLLKNENLDKAMVSTAKDGSMRVDQQKAQQVIDMQSIKNVFEGDGGKQHIQQVNQMFNEVGGKPSTPGAESAEYKQMDAQRTKFEGEGHKPGDTWSDKDGVYSLDSKGNLLEVTGTADKRDIKWVGQNGQSYEKDPSGKETWTKGGREITADNGKYQFKDEFGNTTSIDGNKTVRHVADGTITSYNQNREAITREAASQLNDGISTNPNAALYSHHDADGNQLVKDSLKHGETIFAKDGKTYRVHDGQVFLEGKDGQEQKAEKLPSFLKRNADGSLQFDDININSRDFMRAAEHNTKMADKTATITAGPDDKPLTVTAGNGNVSIGVKGEFQSKAHTDANGVTTISQTDAHGNPEFSYNSQTGTMRGDGITFTSQGSHIQGARFAVSRSGQIESASSWDADNSASGIYDAGDSYSASSYGDGSGDGNSDANGGNGDGTGSANNNDGSGGSDGSGDAQTDADTPGSYEQYDREKDHEEKVAERKLSKWDAMKAKHEAAAVAHQGDETGVDKWREDLKAGKFLYELPKDWQIANIKQSVDVSGLQSSIARSEHGTVDTGDVGSVETAKDQLVAAASKFGFDADGFIARLDGVEHKIEREVANKLALEEVGATSSPERMWRVSQLGGGVAAAREVEQRESA